jgi:hypothetical protein
MVDNDVFGHNDERAVHEEVSGQRVDKSFGGPENPDYALGRMPRTVHIIRRFMWGTRRTQSRWKMPVILTGLVPVPPRGAGTPASYFFALSARLATAYSNCQEFWLLREDVLPSFLRRQESSPAFPGISWVPAFAGTTVCRAGIVSVGRPMAAESKNLRARPVLLDSRFRGNDERVSFILFGFGGTSLVINRTKLLATGIKELIV